MAKLIFCFDGTCNDPSDSGDFADDSSISNVLKLHALFGGSLVDVNDSLANGGEEEHGQRSFYYSGVGTYGNRFKQFFNKTLAPSFGDVKKILSSAEKDLRNYHKEGDEIFIFGFSRGAAIARMFAAKHVGKKPVKFLGVFDTVAALRASLEFLNRSTYPACDVLFENGTLDDHVDNAVHLVSIDEQRLPFQPTLFKCSRRRYRSLVCRGPFRRWRWFLVRWLVGYRLGIHAQ